MTGRAATGPVLDRAQASGVGREPIALAHAMTVAELAVLFNAEFVPRVAGRPAELETVPMKGWRRSDFFDATGLPWVPPSPNMPTPDTALVYARTCLFEGTNLSEGRGTTRPFELLGADGIDRRWAAAITALATDLGLPGVHFREAHFAPTFSKFQGKTIGGVQLHVHDRRAFDPVRTGIALLITAKRTWPDFAWRPDHWIDKLTGTPRVRTMIDAGAGVDEVAGAWQEDLAGFRRMRREYLRYLIAGGGAGDTGNGRRPSSASPTTWPTALAPPWPAPAAATWPDTGMWRPSRAPSPSTTSSKVMIFPGPVPTST
ncbi:hypothetical protein SRIMM317S_02435 [Streptomyces rimosus subsp. rimosus]